MLTNLIRSLFYLSIIGMVWWTFVWPFLVSLDTHDPALRIGSVLSLMSFFGSLIGLLVIRHWTDTRENC